MAIELNTKKQLHLLCQKQIEERLQILQGAVDSARLAQKEDTKSSAGDKYETSREMMTQEIEKNMSLWAQTTQQKQLLAQIPLTHNHAVIQSGSAVHTNQGNFYIAISGGMLEHEGKTYHAVSSISPIGKVLMGKKSGESFSFNGNEYVVLEIL